MTAQWNIEGEYFESCNCDVVCACLVQNVPPRGRCDAAMAFQVSTGHYGDISLDGLKSAVMISFPGPGKMRDGNWTAALYIDDSASKDQADALTDIFSGQAGGPMAMISGLISNFLGVKSVPIEFIMEGNKRQLAIPNVMTIDIEAVTGRDGSDPLWVTNAAHPVTSQLSLACSNAYNYKDYNLAWDVSETNGHFAPFSWHN
ncbi:MAG TPA: hypothetical protein DCZ13_10015 [Porticoccaceae bacterium]|nr:hypothetical protein [Porticoccaceae bacterium]